MCLWAAKYHMMYWAIIITAVWATHQSTPLTGKLQMLMTDKEFTADISSISAVLIDNKLIFM